MLGNLYEDLLEQMQDPYSPVTLPLGHLLTTSSKCPEDWPSLMAKTIRHWIIRPVNN